MASRQQMECRIGLASVLALALALPVLAQKPIEKAARGSGAVVPVKKAIPNAGDTGLKEVEPGADQPIISIEEAVHDFGVTWVGPTMEHTFKITNKGTKPLEILKVRPSCGCTIAGAYPRKLEPGETGDFPFKINSNKLRGKYEKPITVTSNDPVNSDIRLRLRGEVKRYVEVMPAAANFGSIYGGQEAKRVLKVTNNTEQPLALELDLPKEPEFGFDLVEVEPGKQYEIHVTCKASDKIGAMRSQATLKTNIDAQKEIQIAATATVPKRLDLVPSILNLPAPAVGSEDKGATRIIRFTNYGSSDVKVLEATVDDAQVAVTFNERQPGKNYDVRLQFPAGYNPPATGRTLTVKTDDAEFPTMTVPIKGPASRVAERKPQRRPAEELVGKPIPRFSAKTIDGKPLGADTAKEAITVMDFFAVNCGFCGKQIPRLEQIRQEYEGKGVRFVAVSQTMRKKFSDDEVKDKLKTFGFRGELVIDHENTIGPLFSATSFPTMTILGKDGKVAAVNIGNIADLEKRMKGQLDALIEGKPLPKFETTAARTPRKRPAEEMVGKAAPQFKLATMDGKALSSDEFTGHPATVLNFVAPNCGFCKKQLPNVEKVRSEYEAKGVRFVNLSQTMRKEYSPEEAADVFKQAGSRLELAIDKNNEVGKKFQATSYPTMMIVGKDGKVAHVNIGAKADIEAVMKSQLDALIAGKAGTESAAKEAATPKAVAVQKVEEKG